MNKAQAYWYCESFNGCDIILLQAYSLEFHQKSVLDSFARNQNLYKSRDGFMSRNEIPDFKYFDGPWMNAKEGECWCGCKSLIKPPKRKWAGEGHASLIHYAKNIVESPGPSCARAILHVLQRGCCALCMEDLHITESELDHKIEVINGGGGCWIDNLQNLCKRCHAIKTASYATDRALANRQAKQPIVLSQQLSLF